MTAPDTNNPGNDAWLKPYKLAAIGMHVLPCDPFTKAAYSLGWQHLATTDTTQIRAWQNKYPGCLWAIHAEKSGVIVADIDMNTEKGKDGWHTIEEHQVPLPDTFHYDTRSGGDHYYYADPGTIPLGPTTNHRTPDGTRLADIDRRAGNSYAVWWGPIPDQRPTLTEAPAWLLTPGSNIPNTAEGLDVGEWLLENAALPTRPLHNAERLITDLEQRQFGHTEMVEAQASLIRTGQVGNNIAPYLERLRDAWIRDPWSGDKYVRDWTMSLRGAVQKFGRPDKQDELGFEQRAQLLATIPAAAERAQATQQPTDETGEGEPATDANDTTNHDTPEDDDGIEATWRPVDLTPYLDGTYTPPAPTMLQRTDGPALLYPGLVHDFHGESESGKSLVAQAESATRIQAGEPVAYVDFESDPGQIVNRMIAFGCTPQQLATDFTYIRPEGSPYAAHETDEWAALLTQTFTLVILDGVTDALGQYGASTKDNDEIAAWHRHVPRALATKTGAAVVLIDHVVKSNEGRGRFAIGGQTKMAAIDGASYLVEVIDPIGKGMSGTLSLRVGKDRPGEIRPHCGTWSKEDRTQEAARITIDSTGNENTIHVTIEPPTTQVGDKPDDSSFRPTGVMEKLSRLLELEFEPVGTNKLFRSFQEDGGKARRSVVLDAIRLLIEGEYIVSSEGPRGSSHLRSARVYRQTNDPMSESFTPAFAQEGKEVEA